MNNKSLVLKLKELNACSDAMDWLNGMDLQTAWDKCERADWMLWFICRMEIGTKKERIHVICDCAETALEYVPKDEDRPRLAIEATRIYADNPTTENLEKVNQAAGVARAAEEAAWVAWAARAAAWAAWAAWAAARVAGVARAAAWAAWAAEEAAWAAWAAWAARAAWTAARAARAAAHKKMCTIIRSKIKICEKEII